MARKLLLGAIIDDGNAVREKGKCHCILEKGYVVSVICETRLILIFGEGAQEGGVLAIRDDGVVLIFNASERERGIVQERGIYGVPPLSY